MLRRLGRDAEADAELKELRALHPGFVVPEAALGRGDALQTPAASAPAR
jgi:hypothetical protein